MTVIKFSTDTAHKYYMVLMLKINAIALKSFDLEKYDACYDGTIEQGIRITFFEDVSRETLEKIHCLLLKTLVNYNCYYLNSETFEGCICKYLYNTGCSVEGVYE